MLGSVELCNARVGPRDTLVVAVDQDGGGLTLDGALAGPLEEPTRDVVLDAAAAGEVDRVDRREGERDRGWGRDVPWQAAARIARTIAASQGFTRPDGPPRPMVTAVGAVAPRPWPRPSSRAAFVTDNHRGTVSTIVPLRGFGSRARLSVDRAMDGRSAANLDYQSPGGYLAPEVGRTDMPRVGRWHGKWPGAADPARRPAPGPGNLCQGYGQSGAGSLGCGSTGFANCLDKVGRGCLEESNRARGTHRIPDQGDACPDPRP